ncbi:hypothetical protein ACFY12_08405 [Streptomyces sp. NPDC001339]|uniref:hypothetical protein n=1 Tax=Streptomyces sp. NPDC001339 TaxID=3364563 RepID=UPI0036D07772
MGEIDEEIAGEVAGLQAGISSVLRELAGLPDEDPRYEALFAQLVQAGSALLEYEATVPARREEPHWKASKRVLAWSAWVHTVRGAVARAGVVDGLDRLGVGRPRHRRGVVRGRVQREGRSGATAP